MCMRPNTKFQNTEGKTDQTESRHKSTTPLSVTARTTTQEISKDIKDNQIITSTNWI